MIQNQFFVILFCVQIQLRLKKSSYDYLLSLLLQNQNPINPSNLRLFLAKVIELDVDRVGNISSIYVGFFCHLHLTDTVYLGFIK
ncbi:hypothetical protein AQUCO_00900150v1 [Aquilegia coerulea]|uniref:Uncharacterized protein n=1 Tax=Aquilegia coerulea TaxID=218851 RepID=A0A2G5EC83_AQUCA|nr:hypothetical protein AQUCO_00900150v1 [Aquilegia coerulea]